MSNDNQPIRVQQSNSHAFKLVSNIKHDLRLL